MKGDDPIYLMTVVGGDGTLNEVLNGITSLTSTAGVIPTGSGNDFGRNLKLPKTQRKPETNIASIKDQRGGERTLPDRSW